MNSFFGFILLFFLVSQFACAFSMIIYGCVFAGDGQYRLVTVLASPVSLVMFFSRICWWDAFLVPYIIYPISIDISTPMDSHNLYIRMFICNLFTQMISPFVPGKIPLLDAEKSPGSNFQPLAMAGFGWIEFPDGSRTWVELRDCVGSRPVTGEVNTLNFFSSCGCLEYSQMNWKDQMTQWCRIWMNLVYGVVLTLLCVHLRKWKKASSNWRVLLQVPLKHAQILPGTRLKSPHQWIGLRENLQENLQETTDFAMKWEFL